MVEKKRGRGGARPGAGRKPSEKPGMTFSVWCTVEDHEEIRRMAESEGKRISRFITDRIFGRE